MSIKAAAEHLGVSQNTVRRLYDEGRISGLKTPGGHRRLVRQDVVKLATSLKNDRWGIQYPPKE